MKTICLIRGIIMHMNNPAYSDVCPELQTGFIKHNSMYIYIIIILNSHQVRDLYLWSILRVHRSWLKSSGGELGETARNWASNRSPGAMCVCVCVRHCTYWVKRVGLFPGEF